MDEAHQGQHWVVIPEICEIMPGEAHAMSHEVSNCAFWGCDRIQELPTGNYWRELGLPGYLRTKAVVRKPSSKSVEKLNSHYRCFEQHRKQEIPTLEFGSKNGIWSDLRAVCSSNTIALGFDQPATLAVLAKRQQWGVCTGICSVAFTEILFGWNAARCWQPMI